MGQDGFNGPLVKITPAGLRIRIAGMSLQNVKDIYFRLVQWKRCFADRANPELFASMLRKESIVQRELSARKLTDSPEFRQWKHELQQSLTRDGRIVHHKKA